MNKPSESLLTSVIIVSRDSGEALYHTVSSVLRQTAPVELVIVNNGNPEAVENRLAALAKGDPRVQLVTGHGNAGYAKGNNLGAQVARGDYFLFLGPELSLPPDAISRLQKLAQQSKGMVVLGARLLDEKGKDLPEARQKIISPLEAFVDFLGVSRFFPKFALDLHKTPLPQSPEQVPAVSGLFLFVSAIDFKRLKRFDEGYATVLAAMDFCLKVRRAEGKIYFVPSIQVKGKETTSVRKALFSEEPGLKDAGRYFYENFSYTYPQPILWLLYVVTWFKRFIFSRLIK